MISNNNKKILENTFLFHFQSITFSFYFVLFAKDIYNVVIYIYIYVIYKNNLIILLSQRKNI